MRRERMSSSPGGYTLCMRAIPRRRRLGPPRLMTGRKRRRINPNKGLVKILERNLDIIVSRFLYPHLNRVWNPYSWLLERRFVLTEASVSPSGWPAGLDPLRVLLLSDIHTGIFLKPQTLADTILALMDLEPDLVAISGDIVTGHSSEVRPYLAALAPLNAPRRALMAARIQRRARRARAFSIRVLVQLSRAQFVWGTRSMDWAIRDADSTSRTAAIRIF